MGVKHGIEVYGRDMEPFFWEMIENQNRIEKGIYRLPEGPGFSYVYDQKLVATSSRLAGAPYQSYVSPTCRVVIGPSRSPRSSAERFDLAEVGIVHPNREVHPE